MSDTTPLSHQLIVQKYGGATLSDPTKIKQVARRVFDLYQSGTKVVVVVSAMGETTNQLISLAHQVSDHPQLRELDMLLTAGERISMSLLSIALNDLGGSAISFTGSQAGILTDDLHINANIIDVKAFRVEEALTDNKIVILAGFQGVSPQTKEITTLGRGGSDISAVAISAYLKADRCEILKDVDCVYTADPKIVKKAKPISQLNYRHLLEMTTWGAKVLNYRSVKLAQEKNVTLYVGPAAKETEVGTVVTNDFKFEKSGQPLSVNSFTSVFEIESSLSPADIERYLIKKQVGQIQFLKSEEGKYLITAPTEVMQSLHQLDTESLLKVTDTDLSSVSITFTDENYSFDESLIKKFEIRSQLKTKIGMHFFIRSKDRNAFIENLHSLIS